MIMSARNLDVQANQVTAHQALRFDGVTCTFASNEGAGANLHRCSGCQPDGPRRRVLSVVGPTGCGKSTLLNVAAGLIRPSVGTLSVFGKNLSQGLNKDASYLFQADALMPWKTAGRTMSPRAFFSMASRRQKPLKRLANGWCASDWTGMARNTHIKCPAACANAPAWRRRWRSIHASCSWMSPSARSTSRRGI